MSDATASPAVDPRRPQVEDLLTQVFKLMEYPARLDFKDLADGSLGVAVHFDGELPGITPGKRSHLVDSVQFWLNKVVNRPNVPRRWVNLGVGDFPPPRTERAPQPEAQPAQVPPVAAPSAPPAAKPQARTEKPKDQGARDAGKPERAQEHRRQGREADERSLSLPENPALAAAGRLLAEKAVKHGRLYGVMLLPQDARAAMLKAADAVAGLKAKAEGEGHWRRVVFTPDKVTPISRKQVMPDYDDEEDE